MQRLCLAPASQSNGLEDLLQQYELTGRAQPGQLCGGEWEMYIPRTREVAGPHPRSVPTR
jgi:hypothetical protein